MVRCERYHAWWAIASASHGTSAGGMAASRGGCPPAVLPLLCPHVFRPPHPSRPAAAHPGHVCTPRVKSKRRMRGDGQPTHHTMLGGGGRVHRNSTKLVERPEASSHADPGEYTRMNGARPIKLPC
jgi:hypothetical protein